MEQQNEEPEKEATVCGQIDIITQSGVDVVPKKLDYFANKVICKRCGKILDETMVYCPRCGKKIPMAPNRRLRKRIFVVSAIILCMLLAGAGVYHVQIVKENEHRNLCYNSAMKAVEERHFTEAKDYLKEISNYGELYPEESAYIEAGILAENGEYFKAYKAMNRLSYQVPDSVIEWVKNKSYVQAQKYYRTACYVKATEIFKEIKEYKNSSKYLTLMVARNSKTDLHYNKLIEILDFYDAKDIIRNSAFYLKNFLKGTWRTENRAYYFTMSDDYFTQYNLPSVGSGNHYYLTRGVYSLGNSYTNCTENFRITILDKDKISIYCYKNHTTYSMYRQ